MSIFILFFGLHNSVLCYLFCFTQIILALAMGSSFSWLLCLFDIFPLFCFFSISSLSGPTRCSRLILYFPCLTPRVSHSTKSPGSFCCIMVLETKIWMLSVLAALRGSLLLGPLSSQSQKIYMCVLTYVYMYIYSSILTYVELNISSY